MPNIYYKYRSLDSWDFFLDILFNSRLYAAVFTELNDPMEGFFTYSQDQVSDAFIQQMQQRKTSLKICSLSTTFNNTLMWSYYSASHSGIVLGIEIPYKHQKNVKISKVRYNNKAIFKGFLGSNAETEARKVLSKKLPSWKHESEVRVFTSEQFVPVKIRSIYLGLNMKEDRKRLLENLIRLVDPEISVHVMTRELLDAQYVANGI